MADVVLKNIKKVYPNIEPKKKKKGEPEKEKKNNLLVTEEGVLAVHDFNLEIKDNEFIVLVGPSGCGKSTTLRMIAGLETPTSGRITIGDQVVFDSALGINIPANKRKVGFLFQNYALWPNMTVYENISFGLKNIKEPLPKVDFEAKNAARLAEILEQPAEVVRVLEECRDKDGRLDQKKAQLKLVDTFTISIYTAKQLLSYRLEQSPDLSGEIASLRGRVEAARQSAAAAGGELDGEFRLVKGGQVITETRKLTREEIDLTVRRVARIVKIGMFMDRYPAEPEPELGGTPRDYMGKVLAYCQRYANSFTPESRGLMFIGSAGLGKTHMALAIADTVLNRGFDVLYTSSAALAAQLGREHFDRAAEDPWLDACKEADLLILDDLGTEYISQLTISVLYELINTRMLCHRPTIYTSNIVDSSIFEARYTEKVASRILGSCQIFKFFGTDQRLKRGGKR